MADTTIDAHAMLDDWVLCTLTDGRRFVIGVVSGDSKGRFQDGARMSTSLIETPGEIAEGGIVATENSRYLLGRRETDVGRAHEMVAAFAQRTLAERDRE